MNVYHYFFVVPWFVITVVSNIPNTAECIDFLIARFVDNRLLVSFLLPRYSCLFQLFPLLCKWGFVHRGAVYVLHVLFVGRWGPLFSTFTTSLQFLGLCSSSPHFLSCPFHFSWLVEGTRAGGTLDGISTAVFPGPVTSWNETAGLGDGNIFK